MVVMNEEVRNRKRKCMQETQPYKLDVADVVHEK